MRPIKFRAWDKYKKWIVYDFQDAHYGLWSERNSDEIEVVGNVYQNPELIKNET